MYTVLEKSLLTHCILCPRACGVNRMEGETGYCNSDAGFYIAAICAHTGEEPVISGKKGICNVFFSQCNLQCIYCQNHEISDNRKRFPSKGVTLKDVVDRICAVLETTGNYVGFVSPSHFVPQMMAIIRALHDAGKNPVFVYNSNGYDSVATLKMLEGIIDIYLPDFKYLDARLAKEYSAAADYPEVVVNALKEMLRQKGTSLRLGDNGMAEFGMIIRHLVLPEAAEKSIEILRFIAEELSDRCHVSLMAQYFPTIGVNNHPILSKKITEKEYRLAVNAFQELGFIRGWVQEMESSDHYQPFFESGLIGFKDHQDSLHKQ